MNYYSKTVTMNNFPPPNQLPSQNSEAQEEKEKEARREKLGWENRKEGKSLLRNHSSKNQE
jgi:hypothetical protein